MRPPEIIETPRLRLRPVAEADAHGVFAYAGASRPTRFMNFTRHSRLEESVAFARRCAACWVSGSAFPWAITRRGEDELLGVIELRLAPPKAEFGYILREQAWGHGFASGAATAVVEQALSQPAIFRVWATCHPENVASARVLVKAGLKLEATLANWEARPQLGEAAGPSLAFARVRASTAGPILRG